MNDFEKSRQVWRRMEAIDRIDWERRKFFPIAFDKDLSRFYTGPRHPDEIMARFERYLRHLCAQEAEDLRGLLQERMKALANEEKTDHTLEHGLARASDECRDSLAGIPPSLDKAKGSLMGLIDVGDFLSDQEYWAMCLLREHVTPAIVEKVVARWKADLRKWLDEWDKHHRTIHIEHLNGGPSQDLDVPRGTFSRSHLFWLSRDDHGTLDAISRYRFMEVFELAEFPETLAEIEDNFATMLAERALDPSTFTPPPFNELLISASPMLCGRIRSRIDMALGRIADGINAEEGWWPSHIHREGPHRFFRESVPSTYVTALSCLVLLRLSRSDRQLSRARLGVQWLAKQQQLSGAWACWDIEYEESDQESSDLVAKLVEKDDLFTTLLAAEAIRLTGPHGYQHTLSLGDLWIMAQQEKDGSWRCKGLPFPLATVLSLEYLQRRSAPLSSLGSYLGMARAFILRSRELVSEDNIHSRQLAMITACQGLEALLYACLSHSSVNLSVFLKPNETIGVRKALRRLQTHFQDKGVLLRGGNIEYKNKLDKLAYVRDQVVHKGASVDQGEGREAVEATVAFADLQCQRLFGHSLQ